MTLAKAVEIGLNVSRYRHNREALLTAWDKLANLPVAQGTRQTLAAQGNIEGELHRQSDEIAWHGSARPL